MIVFEPWSSPRQGLTAAATPGHGSFGEHGSSRAVGMSMGPGDLDAAMRFAARGVGRLAGDDLVWSKCGQDRDAAAGPARRRHCDLRFRGVARSGPELALPPSPVRGEGGGERLVLRKRRSITAEVPAVVVRWCGLGGTTRHQPGAAGRGTCRRRARFRRCRPVR